MRKNTTFWGQTDKIVVVGECPPKSDHYTAEELVSKPFQNGFRGTLFWAFNDPSFPIATAIDAMNEFAKSHSNETGYHVLLVWMKAVTSSPPRSIVKGGYRSEVDQSRAAAALAAERSSGSCAHTSSGHPRFLPPCKV